MCITSLKVLAVLIASAVAGSAFAADMKPMPKTAMKAPATAVEAKPAKMAMHQGMHGKHHAMHAKHHAGKGKMMGSMMHMPKTGKRVMSPAPAKVAAKPPGSCGTNMYWKAGQCMDARNKKG